LRQYNAAENSVEVRISQAPVTAHLELQRVHGHGAPSKAIHPSSQALRFYTPPPSSNTAFLAIYQETPPARVHIQQLAGDIKHTSLTLALPARGGYLDAPISVRLPIRQR